MNPDLASLAQSAADLLKAGNQTVAVAESSTAGLISACLLAVPGASAYFKGGSVVYTLEARKELLRIRREDVAGMEPLTEAMVLAFARRAREQLDAVWGVAELGVAGPTGARYGHPPGISVIGIAGPDERSLLLETGDNNRERNMWAFTEAALNLLSDALRARQG